MVNFKRAFRWTVFVVTKESKDPNNRVFLGLYCLVEMFILLYATCASVTTEGTRFLSDYNFIRELEEIKRLLFLPVSALSLNMTLRLKRPPPPPLHENNVKIKIRNHEKIMPFYGEENVKISPIYHLSSLKYSLVTSVTLRELTFARFSLSQCRFDDYPWEFNYEGCVV